MVTALLVESAGLMLIGMGSVFCFLWLLVIFVSLLSRVTQRYFPVTTKQSPADNNSSSANTLSPSIIAAITAAIHQHRQPH
ncbi:OadG family protein [Rheinheimera sp. WS51]|uniref:OadG family protein n=1 Tax=Rheinheimera sp. WS51 TaxID=3425886 RepID=UPI003D92529C